MARTKRIAVPICWAIYRVADDVIPIVGQSVAQPPTIVMETMVFQGKATREAIIHTLHIGDGEGSDDHDEHDHLGGPWADNDEEDEE